MATTQSTSTRKASTGKSTARSRKPDAIALLKADHREVEAMFEKYEKIKAKADDSKKSELVKKICAALKLHTQLEEQIFYPAARAAFPAEEQEMLDEADVEHASAKALIAQLEGMTPDQDLYDAKVKVLTEYVKHHVKEEEREMFKEARKADMDLRALGEQIAEAKAGRPSPAPASRQAAAAVHR